MAFMADLKIDFEMPSNAGELYPRLQESIAKNKGTMTGDMESGSFEIPTPFGPVKGNYQINGSAGSVIVTEKPVFLADSLIEGTLRDALAKYGAN